MSHGFVAVQWNRRKLLYDLCIWACVALYLALFIGASDLAGADALSAPIVLMRALSTCAFLMLNVILCIGPLARLSPRFLPLLYNRRHLGVSMFVVALLHAALAIYWYHGFGVINPLASIAIVGGDFPFQLLGAIALAILFLMAATSHDYWNATLGGPLWKAIHMLVYPAYALIIAHILFGALQQNDTGFAPWMAMASVCIVGGLHILASLFKSGADFHAAKSPAETSWLDLCDWHDIPINRAQIFALRGAERVAVFRYRDNAGATKIAAVSNVCQHQNGPLGEGRVMDGLITCPWHGYQYRPEDGCSPPPFGEKIPTYRVKVEGARVLLDPAPLPPGSPRPVVEIPGEK
ncbi:MAG: ferric reductase-like transmembrane domain-containing protein [Gammaproteobacteria bacterium]|nr:ferric reductase-like transmembrane domain-containing protein [Gammaproteobacteria bacterium]